MSPSHVKKVSKMRPNTDDPRQSTWTCTKMRRLGKQENGQGRSHHGQAVVPDTQPCCQRRMVVRPPPPICGFLRGFSASCTIFSVLLLFCLLKGMYLDIVPPHSIHHSPSSLVQIIVAFERKSERQRFQGFHPRFPIQRFKRVFG